MDKDVLRRLTAAVGGCLILVVAGSLLETISGGCGLPFVASGLILGLVLTLFLMAGVIIEGVPK